MGDKREIIDGVIYINYGTDKQTVIGKLSDEDKVFTGALDIISKMYAEIKKDIKEYEKVCIYDFDRELAETYFIAPLKRFHNIETKYIHDGANGFIKRLK